MAEEAASQHQYQAYKDTGMLLGVEKAIESHDYSDIEEQLKKKRDPNARNMVGSLPLEIAAWKGDQKMINILIKAGANPKLCKVKEFYRIKKIANKKAM